MIISENGQVTQLSILVLGDAGVGKTSFVQRFLNPTRTPSESYTPTLLKSYTTQYIIEPYAGSEPERIVLNIMEIGGEHYDLQTENIKQADCYFIMYSCDQQETFKSCYDYYEKILRLKFVNFVGSLPIILIGNKSELESKEVSFEYIKELSEIMMISYMEASSIFPTTVALCFKKLIALCRDSWMDEMESSLIKIKNGREKKADGKFRKLKQMFVKENPDAVTVDRRAPVLASMNYVKSSAKLKIESDGGFEVHLPTQRDLEVKSSFREMIDRAYQDYLNGELDLEGNKNPNGFVLPLADYDSDDYANKQEEYDEDEDEDDENEDADAEDHIEYPSSFNRPAHHNHSPLFQGKLGRDELAEKKSLDVLEDISEKEYNTLERRRFGYNPYKDEKAFIVFETEEKAGIQEKEAKPETTTTERKRYVFKPVQDIEPIEKSKPIAEPKPKSTEETKPTENVEPEELAPNRLEMTTSEPKRFMIQAIEAPAPEYKSKHDSNPYPEPNPAHPDSVTFSRHIKGINEMIEKSTSEKDENSALNLKVVDGIVKSIVNNEKVKIKVKNLLDDLENLVFEV
jgi:GTPase SAR1 family protein